MHRSLKPNPRKATAKRRSITESERGGGDLGFGWTRTSRAEESGLFPFDPVCCCGEEKLCGYSIYKGRRPERKRGERKADARHLVEAARRRGGEGSGFRAREGRGVLPWWDTVRGSRHRPIGNQWLGLTDKLGKK